MALPRWSSIPIKAKIFKIAGQLRPEYVVAVRGIVSARPPGTVNSALDTGEIEVYSDTVEILNKSETPPFEVMDDSNVSLELRLKHRYLDLRRPIVQKRLIFRHKICQTIREYLDSLDFVDIETPVLTKSTRKGQGIIWCPAGSILGSFTHYPSRPSFSNKSSWWLAMIATFKSYAVFAMKTSERSGSRSLHKWIWRCLS